MSDLFTLHKVEGRRIRLTSDTQRDPRTLLPIEGTKFRLAVPYSIPANPCFNYEFELGEVHFKVVRKYGHLYALRPDRPLPASWLIDISGEVPRI